MKWRGVDLPQQEAAVVKGVAAFATEGHFF